MSKVYANTYCILSYYHILEQLSLIGRHRHSFYRPRQNLLLISWHKPPYRQLDDVHTKFSLHRIMVCTRYKIKKRNAINGVEILVLVGHLRVINLLEYIFKSTIVFL